jgi:hypothetical protein
MLSAAGSKSLFNHFSFQVIDNDGAHDFSDFVGQDISAMEAVVRLVRIDTVVQFRPDFHKGHALVFEALDLLDDHEVLRAVTTLAALGSLRDDDALEFLFPETKSVGWNPGALAHFLDGQSFIGHNRRADSS